MKWIDYREKLGVGFNDSEKLQMFTSKIYNRLSSVFQEIVQDYNLRKRYEIIIEKYYTEIGELAPYQANLFHIVKNIADERSLVETISKYIALLNTIKQEEPKEEFDVFLSFLEKSLAELKIECETICDADGIFIFPKGAPELDDALVSQPLEWLSEYPNARTAFVKALKEYAELTPDNANDVADKFRKALETFFHEYFGGGKTLENYKTIYGTYLKSQNVPAEISGNFETLLQTYTNYMNAYVKHHNKTGKNVLEYIMYQTGNIIRLLITLKREDTDNAD